MEHESPADDPLGSRESTQLREPVLSETDDKLLTDSANALRQTLGPLFDNAFRESILPDHGEFRLTDVPLYTPDRHWLMGDKPATTNDWPAYHYEQLLLDTCWEADTHPLIFIRGTVGCGKSTFVKFVMRCYCPSHPGDSRKPPGTNILFLNVDLRSVRTTERFDDILYKTLYERIHDAIRKVNANRPTEDHFEIETDAGYAMYDPVFHWGKTFHTIARGEEPESVYRARKVADKEAAISKKDWVEFALRHISNCMDGAYETTNNPFTKICICLDNLDQSPFDVQSHAMVVVRRWLEPETESIFRIWKVMIPLWPSTLDVIKRNVDPLPAAHDILLGAPKPSSLLQKRSEHLEKVILTRDLRTRWCEATMGTETERSAKENQLFVNGAMRHARKGFCDFLEKAAGGSARRQLLLWNLTLASRTVYQEFMLRVDPQNGTDATSFEDIGEYYLYDGMLTGPRLGHCRSWHPILNLFFVLPELSAPRDALIGLHILHLIRRNIHSRTRVDEFLRPLGYERNKIEAALSMFRAKHFLEWESEEQRDVFEFNRQVGDAHANLLENKAYLDHMALVTPVPAPVLQDMDYTTYRSDDFLQRARTTLAFLTQLYSDEVAFCDPELCPHVSDRTAFRTQLQAVAFPWYSKSLAACYRERLLRLKKNRFGAVKEAIEQHWRDLETHEVFTNTCALGDRLLSVE